MKYKARETAWFGNKQAQIYGEALEEIQEKNGGKITPKIVLKEAKEKNSPLHDFFEWDNTKASDNWRLHQARHLIGAIEVVISYDGTEKERRRYLNVRVDNEEDEESSRIYVVTETALTDSEMRKQVLQNALREASYWQTKYEDYTELSKIFQSIRLTKSKLKLFN